MTLELWDTLATWGTFVVIAVTAIAAMVQLRHLRSGNLINGIFSIDEKLHEPAFVAARAVVLSSLAGALEDPVFRRYLAAESAGPVPPEVPAEYDAIRNAARVMSNRYESLGLLVKNGAIETLFLDAYANNVRLAWTALEKYIAFSREESGLSLYENFEYLAVLSEDWLKTRPVTYPKGVRRMQLHNPWARHEA